MSTVWVLCALLGTGFCIQAAHKITFFSPVASNSNIGTLALTWSLMRSQYPLSPLFVYVNGPDEQNALQIRRLCVELSHCSWIYFTQRDIFIRKQNDPFVNVNGAEGMQELFRMYRDVGSMSRTNLIMLLQPDCLVRGRIPAAVTDLCLHSDASVCSHHQPHNIMEPHLLRAIDDWGYGLPHPQFYSFTCGTLWKRSATFDIFSDSAALYLASTQCRYDDACIGCAIAMANRTRLVSNHISDWNFGAHDNMTPVQHDDKRHYVEGWPDIPVGVCVLYDDLKQLLGGD